MASDEELKEKILSLFGPTSIVPLDASAIKLHLKNRFGIDAPISKVRQLLSELEGEKKVGRAALFYLSDPE